MRRRSGTSETRNLVYFRYGKLYGGYKVTYVRYGRRATTAPARRRKTQFRILTLGLGATWKTIRVFVLPRAGVILISENSSYLLWADNEGVESFRCRVESTPKLNWIASVALPASPFSVSLNASHIANLCFRLPFTPGIRVNKAEVEMSLTPAIMEG